MDVQYIPFPSIHSICFSVWQRDPCKATRHSGKTQYWELIDCFIILSIKTFFFFDVGKSCYFIPISGGKAIGRSCNTVAFENEMVLDNIFISLW